MQMEILNLSTIRQDILPLFPRPVSMFDLSSLNTLNSNQQNPLHLPLLPNSPIITKPTPPPIHPQS